MDTHEIGVWELRTLLPEEFVDVGDWCTVVLTAEVTKAGIDYSLNDPEDYFEVFFGLLRLDEHRETSMKTKIVTKTDILNWAAYLVNNGLDLNTPYLVTVDETNLVRGGAYAFESLLKHNDIVVATGGVVEFVIQASNGDTPAPTPTPGIGLDMSEMMNMMIMVMMMGMMGDTMGGMSG